MSSWAVYTNSLTFRLKSLMMQLNKSLLKLALRKNYVSFLVTLTSIFLMMTNMSLLMISSISCILMYSTGFYPLISKPTGITSHSATLIDNIFSSDLENHKFSGILWSDISDHLPIFQITNCSLKPKTKSSVYHKLLITTHNIENFRSHLSSINWDFLQSSSSNALYNSFMDCLYPIY